jgi:hypothetical protein
LRKIKSTIVDALCAFAAYDLVIVHLDIGPWTQTAFLLAFKAVHPAPLVIALRFSGERFMLFLLRVVSSYAGLFFSFLEATDRSIHSTIFMTTTQHGCRTGLNNL